ncbi:MAG: inositol monophosphatase family protein [Candidatus Roseilinea sp.]|uniref:inositol monophosphatase family protein n=1 Tax=Candidatus Roseilinea sp. TaxID=2838777 RepID=UPI0040496357
MEDLEYFWERILSEEAGPVREAWQELDREERQAVRDFLIDASADEGRLDAQRRAAKFALAVVETPPEGALDLARLLAGRAGRRLKETSAHFGISTKTDGTLVTTCDVETSLELCKELLGHFPEHGVLSEEHNTIFRGDEWCWVIDPIDGTTNFAAGFPVWGVLIGLLHFGRPVMGVAEFPCLGYQFHAVRGRGAYLNDACIRVSNATDFASTDLFAICSRTAKLGVLPIPCKIRAPGSMGFEMASVACGYCVGNLGQSVHVWDVAAIWPMLDEAGGMAVVSKADGLFPLKAGVDYGKVAFAVMSACTPELMRQAQNRLRSFFDG